MDMASASRAEETAAMIRPSRPALDEYSAAIIATVNSAND
jgi:hypothetical protein